MVRRAGHNVVSPEEALELFGDGCGGTSGPWIGPTTSPQEKRIGFDTYVPLRDNAALFRTFIDLECSPEPIVNFANRFGLLTDPERGEPVSTWERAIATMRPAVLLWEENRTGPPQKTSEKLITRGNVEAALIEWVCGSKDPQVAAELLTTSAHPLAGGSELVESSRDSGPKGLIDTLAITRFELQHHYIPEIIAANIDRNIQHVRPSFGWDSLASGLKLQLRPSDLLEAMWLQFAEAVGQNKSLRKCSLCDLWFELTPGVSRADKKFCSGACKAKAYRTRLDKA
jgi:hypothetical protein